jgi:hypothetical protein
MAVQTPYDSKSAGDFRPQGAPLSLVIRIPSASLVSGTGEMRLKDWDNSGNEVGRNRCFDVTSRVRRLKEDKNEEP